jgi:hypothetical protein
MSRKETSEDSPLFKLALTVVIVYLLIATFGH